MHEIDKQIKEKELVNQLSGLLVWYFEYDVKKNIQYNLRHRIYQNAKGITTLQKQMDSEFKFDGFYHIGIGNINGIVSNFFEQKPSKYIMRIEDVLAFNDIDELKKYINNQLLLAQEMKAMELEWGDLVNQILINNIRGEIKIEYNEELETINY